MKLFFSEFPADYSQYHFPYQIVGIKELKDNLPQIYDNGFLPFRSKKDWFYLGRSTRIRLSKFELSSENRRILKKTEGLTYSVEPLAQFKYTPAIQKLCKIFADHKFGRGVMPTAAIRKVFTDSNTTHIITFFSDMKPVGYVAGVIHDHFLHYAHPFLDVSFTNSDLGLGMMTKAVQWAKDQHKQFIYLGTSYTENSLYKPQFSGLEFFNGLKWSINLAELKYLIKRQLDSHLLQDRDFKSKFASSLDDTEGMRVSLK